MKNSVFLSAIMLLGIVTIGYANDQKFDFDTATGFNSRKQLKIALHNPPRQFCPPIEKIADIAISTIPVAQKSFRKASAGYFYGPSVPKIINQEHYAEAQRYPAQLQEWTTSVAKQLLVEWDTINAQRTSLINDATAFDNKDSGLYNQMRVLNDEADAQNNEKAQLQIAIDDYNKKCAGQPITQACTNQYNKLAAWVTDWQHRVDTHNAQVTTWNNDKNNLDVLAASFDETLNGWVNSIKGFISKALSFLKGNCTEEEHERLQAIIDTLCSIKRYCSWEQNCEELFSNLAKRMACYNARMNIEEKCYGGNIDQGHQEQINNELLGTDRCREIIAAKDCKPPVSDPAISIWKQR